MTKIVILSLTVFGILCFSSATAKECADVPECKCTFGNKTITFEPNTSGNEALAGTVGAMSSALLSMGIFAIWKLCKKTQGQYERSPSNLSKDSLIKGRNPPPYSSKNDYPRRGSTDSIYGPSTNTNVYRAAVGDDLNTRVGSRADSSTTYRGAGSDWK